MVQHRDESRGARATYHPALDGLRGIFVLAVLLFHAEVPWAPGGFLGVSSFFTLSGFLITRLLVDEWRTSGAIDLKRFWTRRFRRLMPASLLTLALLVLFGYAVATIGQLAALRGDVLSALTYVSNWRFMTQARSYFEIFDRPSPVQHFWSLSIEEQFYLCYPLLVLGVWRRSAAPVRDLARVLLLLTAICVVTGTLLAATGASPSRLYYGTDTRAPELLVGALLALWMASRRDATARLAGTDATAAAGAVVLVAGIGWMREDSSALHHGGLLANAIATAALVHAGVRPSFLGRVLAVTPLVWLGRVSYGVYLYHWPVFLWLDPERTGLAALPLFVLRFGVTLTASVVSYFLVERPVRLERALVGRPLWLAATASAIAITAGAVWITGERRVARMVIGQMRDAQMPKPTGRDVPRVLVVGDSVAANVAGGLRRWAKSTDTRIAVWSVAESACAIGRDGTRPGLQRYRQLRNHCHGWPTQWAEDVDRFDPDVVVAHTGPLDLVDRWRADWGRALAPGDPRFDDWLLGELQAAADVLARRGARLIWLTTPCPGETTMRTPVRAIGALDPARIVHLNSTILPSLWTSRREQLRLFDLYGISCPGGEFHRRIPGTRTTLRSDHIHFTKPGAAWVAERLGPIVLAAARRRHGDGG